MQHEAFDFGITLDGRHHERIQCRVCFEEWPCLTTRYAALEREVAALRAADAELRAAIREAYDRSTLDIEVGVWAHDLGRDTLAPHARRLFDVLAQSGPARGAELLATGDLLAERLEYEHSECSVSVCSAARNAQAWRALAGGREPGGGG